MEIDLAQQPQLGINYWLFNQPPLLHKKNVAKACYTICCLCLITTLNRNQIQPFKVEEIQ